MRNLTIAFLSTVLFITGCNKSEKKEILIKQNVIIAGRIDSVTSKTVSVVFSDLVRGSAYFTQVLDTVTGTFNFRFHLYHAQDLLLKYNRKNLRLFVEPSDSLFITFAAKDFDETSNNRSSSIKFSGSNNTINEELLEYSVFSQTPGFHPNINGKSVKNYMADLTDQIDRENAELDEFVTLYNPSAEFINWAKNKILYSNANYLIHYKAHLFYNKLPRNDSLFDLKLFPVNNEQSLVASTFGDHLWHYVTDRYLQGDSITLKNLIDGNNLVAYNRCMEDILQNEPNSVLRDIMVYKLLSSLIDDSFDDFKTIWNRNDKLMSNQLLIAELKYRIDQKENEKDYGIAFLNDMSKEESQFLGDVYNEILKESNRKLIYLDIWATWCGPCRAEIPQLIDLHSKLKGDNIEFISLCLNSDRSLWQQIVSENNIPGKHFFLDKAQSELLRDKLKFDGFPTYMIIKDGFILNEQAPRPSSGDQILNELKIKLKY